VPDLARQKVGILSDCKTAWRKYISNIKDRIHVLTIFRPRPSVQVPQHEIVWIITLGARADRRCLLNLEFGHHGPWWPNQTQLICWIMKTRLDWYLNELDQQCNCHDPGSGHFIRIVTWTQFETRKSQLVSSRLPSLAPPEETSLTNSILVKFNYLSSYQQLT